MSMFYDRIGKEFKFRIISNRAYLGEQVTLKSRFVAEGVYT